MILDLSSYTLIHQSAAVVHTDSRVGIKHLPLRHDQQRHAGGRSLANAALVDSYGNVYHAENDDAVYFITPNNSLLDMQATYHAKAFSDIDAGKMLGLSESDIDWAKQ